MNQFSPLDDSSLVTPSVVAAPGARTAVDPADQATKPGVPRTGRKQFVLDTNVLLHNPQCIGRFADNDVCIPVDVLSELDRFKNEQSDRGANARAVHRALTAAFDDPASSVLGGVPTDGGGTLRLALFESPPAGSRARKAAWLSAFERVFLSLDPIDHRIIAAALQIQHETADPVILVTKDLNMQLKARAVGLACEDYLNDKVEAADVSSYDLRAVSVEPSELQRFASSGRLDLPPDRTRDISLNEYVLLRAEAKKTMPARLHADRAFHRLKAPMSVAIPGGATIVPINLGQQCFLDALLDPQISLVTCYGHAGTGKTLLAVAAALQSVFAGGYRGVTISRPVVAMGDTLGFLPGTLDEKMRPWLQPIYDALEFLMPPPGVPPGGPGKRRRARPKSNDLLSSPHGPGSPARPYEALIETGVVEIEALCYIRGRSIPERFFILDEAQQLTPLEAKTVVTRMSKNSKLVLVGDPAQIDNPYVDSRSNGLVYTRNRLKAQHVAAHVSLSKGERSPLAELGATLM